MPAGSASGCEWQPEVFSWDSPGPSRGGAIAVLALAIAADTLFGEPPACCHPVVAMGQAIALAEHGAPVSPAGALVYGGLIAVGGSLACWLLTGMACRRWAASSRPSRSALAR